MRCSVTGGKGRDLVVCYVASCKVWFPRAHWFPVEYVFASVFVASWDLGAVSDCRRHQLWTERSFTGGVWGLTGQAARPSCAVLPCTSRTRLYALDLRYGGRSFQLPELRRPCTSRWTRLYARCAMAEGWSFPAPTTTLRRLSAASASGGPRRRRSCVNQRVGRRPSDAGHGKVHVRIVTVPIRVWILDPPGRSTNRRTPCRRPCLARKGQRRWRSRPGLQGLACKGQRRRRRAWKEPCSAEVSMLVFSSLPTVRGAIQRVLYATTTRIYTLACLQ